MTEAELLFHLSFSPPPDDGANSLGSLGDPALGLGSVDLSASAHEQTFVGAMLHDGSTANILALRFSPPARFQRWLNPILGLYRDRADLRPCRPASALRRAA